MKLRLETKEQQDLFNNNIGFAIKMANDWNKKCCLELEDLKSYALESLCVAAKNYKTDRNATFLTYASYVINNDMKRHIRDNNTLKMTAEKNNVGFDDDNADYFEDTDNNIEYNNLLLSVKQILESYPEVQQKAILKYLIEKKTLKQLSAEFNVSMRTMHKWIQAGKEELVNKLKG